jgi:hypothetical protein
MGHSALTSVAFSQSLLSRTLFAGRLTARAISIPSLFMAAHYDAGFFQPQKSGIGAFAAKNEKSIGFFFFF